MTSYKVEKAEEYKPTVFHRITSAIEPETEADPIAIHTILMIFFGNVVGKKAYYVVGATKHYCNLMTVLVGKTAKGRKGTAFDCCTHVFDQIDSTWVKDNIKSGLSSGEGLVKAIQDIKSKDSEGVKQDKRMLVSASEFSSILKHFGRDGNILSEILKKSWDGKDLHILTRKEPLSVPSPHLSLVGEVTLEELKRRIRDTELYNGFANRMMWLIVKRSKKLPHGGNLDLSSVSTEIKELKKAIEFASTVGEIELSESAHEVWVGLYDILSDEIPGVFGAVTSRSEPMVIRLAMIYALADCSKLIEVRHLMIAYNYLWQRYESCTREIFGDSFSLNEKKILDALKVNLNGLTLNEIRNDIFQRNRTATQTNLALDLLVQKGKIYCEKSEVTEGRPPIRYFLKAIESSDVLNVINVPKTIKEK
jgi:hypothetical protein